MKKLALLFSLILLCLTPAALAEERIHLFDVDIAVQTNGDLIITETISVTPEHYQIKRGIYRTFPRYYLPPDGERLQYGYKVLSVTRNGKREPYSVNREGNAYNILIGDEDVYLPRGIRQTYQIRYRVKNQIRYDETFDELYWNATGTYWDLPMDEVRAKVTLPEGAQATFTTAFTGAYGLSGSDYTASTNGDTTIWTVSRPFKAREGLTIGIGIPKGVIDPPSLADKSDIIWQRYGGIILLTLSIVGVFYFYYRSWLNVGQDAPRLPVFPRYHAPEDFSPSAAHYVFFRGFQSKNAFTSALLDLAVKGYLDIAADKKTVTLTRKDGPGKPQLAAHQRKLFSALLGSRKEKVLGKSYDSSFATAYQTFRSDVERRYGSDYFRWNTVYLVVAALMTGAMIFVSAWVIVNWNVWHFALILALVAVNLIFSYFMPAQTRKGEEARAEIAGLRLYLETAEKLAMNAADIHGEKPPPMSKDRYEELLPYAIALQVEKPWSKYFEHVLPDEARDYHPTWYNSGRFVSSSLGGFNRSLSSTISTSVATSAVRPSSSSGGGSFGGGGFSGGGGGGGGGGGW